MKVQYEWLQTFFEDDALPIPEKLAETLIFHAYEVEDVVKVEGGTVLDVDVLPNRAADSLSHRGIAREVSTLLNISMKRDPLRESIALTPATDSVSVTLDESAACSYYIAAHITGVQVTESPEWLKERLESIGQKSINNVVDATNYVLFELGRPTHVFDAKKFSGDTPHIGTRLARKGERIVLLGGEEVALEPTMTVITDATADAPVAIGGVKGGALAEVDESTTDIIIETANFHPTQTRLTAQGLKLRTDASARFENNIADQLAQYGVQAVVALILDIAGGKLEGYATAGEIATQQPEVTVTTQRAASLLGASINGEAVESILKQLDFAYTRDGDSFAVTAPFERRDIQIPEDVIEEIGRVYGYNKIESAQLPPAAHQPAIHAKYAYAELIRNTLTNIGFREVYLYSLRDSGEVALRNALASDKNHLRSNLSTGIVESLDKNEKNMPLLGEYEAVRLFEIGNVFTEKGEATHVALGVRVAGTKKREARTQEILAAAKDALESALGSSLTMSESGETLEFNVEELVQQLPAPEAYPDAPTVAPHTTYAPISQYPFVLRDIAVWVPSDVAPENIIEMVEHHAGDLLKRCDLFDVFEKDNRTSYAFHLVFQSMTETLTDGRVGDIMEAIEGDIASKNGWEIR